MIFPQNTGENFEVINTTHMKRDKKKKNPKNLTQSKYLNLVNVKQLLHF